MYFSHRNTTRWTRILFYIGLYVLRRGLHCKICVKIFQKTVNAKTREFYLFTPNYKTLFFKSIWTLLILSTLDVNFMHWVSSLCWLFEKILHLYLPPPPTNVNDDSILNPRAHSAHTTWTILWSFRRFSSKTQSSFILSAITEQWKFSYRIFTYIQNEISFFNVSL